MSAGRLPVAWRPRGEPLAAAAAVGRGEAARALAQRLLAREDAELARLEGVEGNGLVMVLGEERDLPWADGVVYLGKDPAAPALLLPTTLEPGVPLGLLEGALLGRTKGLGTPLAVLVEPPALVPVAPARPVARVRLLAWLGAQGR